MMGKQSGQIQMVILDIDSMIPDNHLLRQIKNCVNFDFIYEKAAPYYSNTGGFAELILCIKYRIIQPSARIESGVLKMPVYFEIFLLKLCSSA